MSSTRPPEGGCLHPHPSAHELATYQLRCYRGDLESTSNARSKLSVYFATATKSHAWFDPTRKYSHLATLGEGTVAVSLSYASLYSLTFRSLPFCHAQTKFVLLTFFSVQLSLKFILTPSNTNQLHAIPWCPTITSTATDNWTRRACPPTSPHV